MDRGSASGERLGRHFSEFSAQYWLNYNLPRGWFLESNATPTADWEAALADRWTMPLAGGFGKVFTLAGHSLSASAQGSYNVKEPRTGPRGGPPWRSSCCCRKTSADGSSRAARSSAVLQLHWRPTSGLRRNPRRPPTSAAQCLADEIAPAGPFARAVQPRGSGPTGAPLRRAPAGSSRAPARKQRPPRNVPPLAQAGLSSCPVVGMV